MSVTLSSKGVKGQLFELFEFLGLQPDSLIEAS